MTRSLRIATRLFFALTFILTAPSVSAEDLSPAFKALLAGNVAAHVADFSTTLYALQQPGLREGNPVMGWAGDRPVTMSAAKAGMVAVSSWGKVEVYKRRPKLAWVWLVAETSLIAWVATNNYRLSTSGGGR